MSDYYDRQGKPITLAEWGNLHTAEYKRVALDEFDGVRVSTVWLGMDHNWGEGADPIIFETMVFGGDYGDSMWRYATESEAQEGHDRIVAALREGRDPWAT